MRRSHVALVIASHHDLLWFVTVPDSHTSHCEEVEEEANASVNKDVQLVLD